MKKIRILFLIFTLVFVSCKEEKISEKDKRLTKERLEQESDWLNTPTVNSDEVSYWYVVIEKKNNGMKISSTIKQEHSYFSIPEAKEYFNGNCMILNFIQISKETYDELVN